jgi:hypothetical protein
MPLSAHSRRSQAQGLLQCNFSKRPLPLGAAFFVFRSAAQCQFLTFSREVAGARRGDGPQIPGKEARRTEVYESEQGAV